MTYGPQGSILPCRARRSPGVTLSCTWAIYRPAADRADRITGDAEQIFEFFATGWDRSGDIRVRTASAPKGDATRDPTNP